MYRSDRNRSKKLAQRLIDNLDPVAPGGKNTWSAGHHELYTRSRHVAYLELAFHTNGHSQKWLGGKSRKSGWRMGLTIDQRLGYPR